jgi:hypothetical protein
MLKLRRLLPFAVLCLVQGGHAFAGEDSHAGQAVENSIQASGHASASAAHSIAASGQVTSAAFATPMSMGVAPLVSGGVASARTANESMRVAAPPMRKPLRITDEAVTTTPPDEALRRNGEKKSDKKS